MSSRIELNLSRSVTVGLLAAVPWLVLLSFAVIAATEKTWLSAGVPLALIGALGQYRNSGMLRGKVAVGALRLDDEQLYAELSDGRLIPVSVSPASRIGPRLALLKLCPVGTRVKTYSTILLANAATGTHGNVPEDEFRRLRVWLRLGHSQPTSA